MTNNIRQTILRILVEKKSYVSGEELAKLLNVSRTSIWKHINRLREKGYQIASVSHLGYRLISTPKKLIPEEIHRLRDTELIGKEIVYFSEIDSTNSVAKRHALDYPEGTIFLADMQTSGRGRLGRQWDTKPGLGIWSSVLLKPKLRPTNASQFSLLTAVAITDSLRHWGLEALIKWPNDVLVQGKKICGILTEMEAELDRINYIVIGFGINVKHRAGDFPNEVRQIATSMEMILNQPVNRVKFFCDLLASLEKRYLQFTAEGFTEILETWKEYNCTLGKEAKVSRLNQPALYGEALDIQSDGSLLLKLADGQILPVFSGELEN